MKLLIFINTLLLIFFVSCKENENGPLVVTDQTPGTLKNISVENLPGAAKISYEVPDNPGVLYVEAVYSTGNGITRTAKSSVYKNYMVLRGFNSTNEKEIKLYVVNKSENRSAQSTVKIKPLRAPIKDIFETLSVKKDVGGIVMHFYNKEKQQYVFNTLIKDSLGNWINYDRLYTNAEERTYAIYGLAAKPTDFAFYFIDEWQNHSDTLFKTLTPLYEEEIDKGLWSLYPLDNDSYEPLYSSRPITNVWDGTSKNSFFLKPTIPGLSLPNWFTIDLGQSAVLSRVKYFQYIPNNYKAWIYTRGLDKKFEIWGSNNPSIDGSWDSWTLLGTCESVKPSGLPVGQVSDEDIQQALAGEDFSLHSNGVAYRYIRIKTIETWGHRIGSTLGEITLYGQPQ